MRGQKKRTLLISLSGSALANGTVQYKRSTAEKCEAIEQGTPGTELSAGKPQHGTESGHNSSLPSSL